MMFSVTLTVFECGTNMSAEQELEAINLNHRIWISVMISYQKRWWLILALNTV